jgi:uncharacterized membrane protein
MEPTEYQSPTPPSPSPDSSSTGLDANVAGALSYLLGPITGIIFLVLEKRSRFVKFHAAQSIGIFVFFVALGIVMSVLSTVLAWIPVLGFIVALVLGLVGFLIFVAGFFLWLFLMYKAYSGEEWEFPFVGEQSRKIILRQPA